MKQLKKPLALTVIAFAVAGCMQQQEQYPVSETAPESEQERMAYAVGSTLGEFVGDTLDRQEQAEMVLERDLVIAGFVDALKGEAKISQVEAEELITLMQMQYAEQHASVVGGQAQAEGDAYQAQNAQRAEVTVTESGLQYEILAQGEGGPKPKETDLVEVHYHGTLINGEVFDSSVERGEPIVFPLNRVIGGWVEGVQLMSVGDKYRFVIPPHLAYGERGAAGGQIPPHATLVFEVELLGIIDPESDEAAVELF